MCRRHGCVFYEVAGGTAQCGVQARQVQSSERPMQAHVRSPVSPYASIRAGGSTGAPGARGSELRARGGLVSRPGAQAAAGICKAP